MIIWKLNLIIFSNKFKQHYETTIINKKPILAVCGHIHESTGKNPKLESTTVISAGPNGILWQI